MKVKFDDLEVLQACDIDQNLNFLHAFLTQNGRQVYLLKTNPRLKISSQKLLSLL